MSVTQQQKGPIMADKPIIFSAPMVKALLGGRKAQTRRVLKLRGYKGFHQLGASDTVGYDWTFRRADWVWEDFTHERFLQLLPYTIGDRLWVREAHAFWADEESRMAAQAIEGSDDPCIWRTDYKAGARCDIMGGDRWRPSIHMPRWASRLTLIVTDVRVQRLQGISHDDAVAEGMGIFPHSMSAQKRFQEVWNSLHGPEAWAENPWIVALTFTVQRGNIDIKEADHG